MKVNEIFYSCQGEGVLAGEPMAFIRLQGCNLLSKCSFCDTPYAWDGSKGKEMSLDEIHDEVVKVSPWLNSWVCITGGEPMFQEGLLQLVKKLKGSSFRIEVETNGTYPAPNWYTVVDSWVADIKCPSSGVISEMNWFGTRKCDQIKFVVRDQADLDYAKSVIRRFLACQPTVLVSPVVSTGLKPITITDWDLELLQNVWKFCMEERVRFSLQVHKVVFGNRKGI